MKKLFIALCSVLLLCNVAYAGISVDAFVTADDVSVDHLESFRTTVVNAINAANGGWIQAGTVTTTQLDANANPENRWNEAFSDFVYTGLTIPSSASLTTTTASGVAYINGVRVVKANTPHTYTGSKWTWVDLSDNGTYTYTTSTTVDDIPAVATNSIRLAVVSTDATKVVSSDDLRVQTITVTIGASTEIADSDNDTKIQTQESADEDVLRFDTGGSEQVTISDGIFASSVSNDVDIGSSTVRFKDGWFAGKVSADNLYATGGLYIDGISLFNTTNGHDHDGTDSKKTIATNLDFTGCSGYVKSDGTCDTPTTAYTSGFGTLTTGTEESSTQASTDGFLILLYQGGCSNSTSYWIKTDSANPPTTVVGQASGGSGTSFTLIIPIENGNYYLTGDDDGTCSKNHYATYWQPIS